MFRNINKHLILSVDIGGSHISSALVNDAGEILQDSFFSRQIDTSLGISQILTKWLDALNTTLSKNKLSEIIGIGISMPGPFDYENGISLMNGVNKYHSLYGVNIREIFNSHLHVPADIPILFENDAACFGLGESFREAAGHGKVIAITLGTGFGATFIQNNNLLKEGEGVPKDGYLYNTAFKDGIAEDYISSAWITKKYQQLSGSNNTVRDIATKAIVENDKNAIAVFKLFGENLASCLSPWIRLFEPGCLVIGGSISKAAILFVPVIKRIFAEAGINVDTKISDQIEMSAITGAADIVRKTIALQVEGFRSVPAWRKSLQPLMPSQRKKPGPESGSPENGERETGGYDIYPYFSMSPGKIFSGYDSLARWIISQKVVMIDGYGGNDWKFIRERLSSVFKQLSVNVLWFETSAFLKDEKDIDELVKPFLGEEDSVWGKKTSLSLIDFYKKDKLVQLQPDPAYDLNILIGPGAALANWQVPVIYVDMPKNEIQYRMRAGSVVNLGKTITGDNNRMYKRCYFVDWPVLNKHRQNIKKHIAVVADGQWREDINWAFHASIEESLGNLSKGSIRVRPWFEAGAWGGQWMKEHIPSLNKEEINYAWSFELIVPENGLVFESDDNLLEIAFDWLMESDCEAILGRDAARFGTEFPIRFDFLDTFDGGNLSIQCHPRTGYIQEEFGENFTQDETYYMLDCKPGAGVYLGFQDDIQPAAFRAVLEESVVNNAEVDIQNYVQLHPAHKHDLFLIPNGTIHSSGANNLVLEISATPYIFTFKMYDWLRLDLSGKPRPINIEHAFNNLNFDRKGASVKKELLSVPYILEESEQCRIVHLPTHPEHFYDVHRIEFSQAAAVSTNNQCHILMLVEGKSIEVVTANGYRQLFHYAETFIIPAAAGSYKIYNKGAEPVKVIKAFVK